MGQKTHPFGFRLGYTRTWNSRWYAKKEFAKLLHEDLAIRNLVKKRLYHAGISRVEIERSGNQVKVIIHTARPGIIIGRKGAEVDKLKASLEQQYGNEVYVTVKEIKNPSWTRSLSQKILRRKLKSECRFAEPSSEASPPLFVLEH